MRHIIKRMETDEYYIPDGKRCDGKDVNQRPCDCWDRSLYRCRSIEIHDWGNTDNHLGPLLVNRSKNCIKKFG